MATHVQCPYCVTATQLKKQILANSRTICLKSDLSCVEQCFKWQLESQESLE